MQIKNWYQESIFKHFHLKIVLSFCITVIFIELFKLHYVISKNIPVNAQFFWVSAMVGSFFIIAAIYKINLKEKIAFLLFGLAFLAGSMVRKFAPHLYINVSFVLILFEIIGTVSFLLAYKKYENKPTDASITLKIMLLLLVLLLPAIFFWLLGVLSNLVK